MQDIEKIYEEYFEAVNKYLNCLTNNEDISEELTQETFYKAVKNIKKYDEKYDMSAWLCGIAKNLWFDQCRKNKKIINIDEQEMMLIPDKNLVENIVINKDEKINFYKKIQNIDEKSRELVYLRMTGDLTFKEIGNILGKSENWARITFYRAKKILKEGKDDE